MKREFQECKSCSEKSGTPTLCDSCFNNREALWEREKLLTAVTDAFYIEGKNPDYHRRFQQLILGNWKTLWYAINNAKNYLGKDYENK